MKKWRAWAQLNTSTEEEKHDGKSVHNSALRWEKMNHNLVAWDLIYSKLTCIHSFLTGEFKQIFYHLFGLLME